MRAGWKLGKRSESRVTEHAAIRMRERSVMRSDEAIFISKILGDEFPPEKKPPAWKRPLEARGKPAR